VPLHVAFNEQKEVGRPGLSFGNGVRLRADVSGAIGPCCEVVTAWSHGTHQYFEYWSSETCFYLTCHNYSKTHQFSFTVPLRSPDVSDVTGQHGPDHPSVEVTVRDMNTGLTSKGALIATRRLNSAVNTVRVHCADNYSGERTKAPNAEVDE
jgi:hypothetical protein